METTATSAARERRAGVGDVLLDVRDLRTYFHVMDGTVKAVDGVSFSIRKGGRLALVGESGCGKSVTALSIMQLIDIPPGEFAGGEIIFDGVDLLKLKTSALRKIRGGEIAMIFQEPMTSLNPVMSVGDQIMEAVLLHHKVDKKGALAIATQALRDVGVADPTRRVRQYPHELSGGMRQRIMIAMALSCDPKLIIADEPTTALDVTVQAQVLDLIQSLKERFGMAVLLITHDLGVVAETAHRVIVMYAGRKVEEGSTTEIFRDPRHPYTRGLLEAAQWEEAGGDELREIAGTVPSPFDMPRGCSFAPRCPRAISRCGESAPVLQELGSRRPVACFVAQEERA